MASLFSRLESDRFFSVWYCFEKEACSKSHKNMALLKVWNNIQQSMVCAIVDGVTRHSKCVVDNKGGHFK